MTGPPSQRHATSRARQFEKNPDGGLQRVVHGRYWAHRCTCATARSRGSTSRSSPGPPTVTPAPISRTCARARGRDRPPGAGRDGDTVTARTLTCRSRRGCPVAAHEHCRDERGSQARRSRRVRSPTHQRSCAAATRPQALSRCATSGASTTTLGGGMSAYVTMAGGPGVRCYCWTGKSCARWLFVVASPRPSDRTRSSISAW